MVARPKLISCIVLLCVCIYFGDLGIWWAMVIVCSGDVRNCVGLGVEGLIYVGIVALDSRCKTSRRSRIISESQSRRGQFSAISTCGLAHPPVPPSGRHKTSLFGTVDCSLPLCSTRQWLLAHHIASTCMTDEQGTGYHSVGMSE